MVYLFSNRSYGAPFLDAAARYSRQSGTQITVVFSGHRRRDRNENGPVGALRALVARWRSSKEPTAAGLPVLIVDDVNVPSFVDLVEQHDHGVIAGFDQIFGAEAIARFKSFVNFHPSLLPYYRGPEPAYWCIENGETTTGFTIHTVTTRIDSGEIHHQEALQIEPNDDAGGLTTRIANLAVPAFNRWLEHSVSGSPWTGEFLDARALYRHRVDYRSFQDASASQPK